MSGRTLKLQINPKVLRYFREDAGWSVPEIASALQTSEQQINHWERGSEEIPFKALELMAKHFKRPVGWRGKTVCLVSCKRSPEPVFLKWKSMELNPEGDFFVRSGPGTIKLKVEDVEPYIHTRFVIK